MQAQPKFGIMIFERITAGPIAIEAEACKSLQAALFEECEKMLSGPKKPPKKFADS
jgi:hypothetical protein